MDTLKIDIRRYASDGQSAPVDDQYGYWTVTIAEEPISVFSTYSEAETVAKLYARLYKSTQDISPLDAALTAGMPSH